MSPALRSSVIRLERRCKQLRSAFLVLGCHFRVLPQRLATVGSTRIDPSTATPLGFVSFRRNQTRRSNVLLCLTSTSRSQSFSPSQRLFPVWPSWLCFTPHPPVGFRPSKYSPLSQPLHLSAPLCSLAVGRSLDFRALLQLSVRSYIAACYREMQPILSWPLPSPRLTGSRADLGPSPHVLSE